MEPMIEKAIGTGSPLAILVVIVFLFLRFMEKEGDKTRNLFQSINDQNLLARKETQVALMENAQSTRENTSALRASTQEHIAALRAMETAILKMSNNGHHKG